VLCAEGAEVSQMGARRWWIWILVAGLSPAGCYLSYAERGGADATGDAGADREERAPDVPAEVPLDVSGDDAEDEGETIDVTAACRYEPLGALQIGEGDFETEAPHVFWTGSDVAVTMFATGGSMVEHIHIAMSNVAPDLSSHTALRTIGEESHGWGEVARAEDSFGLCWNADPGYDGATYFRRHALDGTAVTTWSPVDPDGEACLALAYGGGRFAATWRHARIEGEAYSIDTRVAVLDVSGALVAEPVDLAVAQDYPGVTPMLAWTGEDFLVLRPADDALEVSRLSTSGVLSPAGRIRAPGAVYGAMAFAGGRFAVAWQAGERGERGLRFQVFGAGLAPAGDELVVEEDGAGAAGPDVAAVADGWVLAWTRGGYPEEQVAMLLHVDPDGLPREPRRVLHVGTNSGYGGPSLAPASDQLFIGLSRYPESRAMEQVFLLRYGCVPGAPDVCAAQDASLPARCTDEISLGWMWTGTGCLELLGCEGDCIGADCDRLAHTAWDCASDRQFCP
jgi:hypothetical protein